MKHSLYLTTILLVSALFTFSVKDVYGQFNGKFDIERHDLDEENFLDWKAYQYPKSWLYRWYYAPNGFLITVGSLSQNRFYIESDLHLTAEFGDYFSILYNRTEDSFYREDTIYNEAELRIGGDVGISLIGIPTYEKKHDNLGGALTIGRRWHWNYLRLSRLDQFFQYNEKEEVDGNNEGITKYDKTPVLQRLEIQIFPLETFLFKVDLKNESETKAEDEDNNEVKTYQGFDYRGTLDITVLNEWIFGVSARIDQEERETIPDTASENQPDLQQRLELKWYEIYWQISITGDDQITFGSMSNSFENTINSAYESQRYEFQTTATQYYSSWITKANELVFWNFELILGTVTVYEKDYSKDDEATDETSSQGKFKIGVSLFNGENAKFFANVSADLDDFDLRVWDGGNVQFQVAF